MSPFFQALENADKTASLAINSLHCPASDAFWIFFSGVKIWYILYAIVLGFFFWKLGWKRALLALVGCILVVVACDQFGNFTKEFFARLRPCHDEWMNAHSIWLPNGKGSLYGFYSAHAANTMGFAVASTMAFRSVNTPGWKHYGVCIFIWSILVGLSRIFLGMHFLGDVITGFAVGALFAWAIMSIFTNERLIQKISGLRLPGNK